MASIHAARPTLPYEPYAAASQVPGFAIVRKFGSKLPVPTAAAAPVWTGTDVASAYPGFVTAGEKLIVNSASAADGAAGANAQTVRVYGLDASTWEMVEEEVDLVGNGASAPTTNTYIRGFRAQVRKVGTYGAKNLAAITVTGATSGAEFAHIPAGVGQTQMAIYTIPAGYVGALRGGFFNYESGKSLALISLNVRENAENITSTYYATLTKQTLRGVPGGATVPIDFDGAPQFLPERSDVWITAQADTVTGNLEVNMFIELIPA